MVKLKSKQTLLLFLDTARKPSYVHVTFISHIEVRSR